MTPRTLSLLAAAIVSFSSIPALFAQTATTDPVGMIQIALPAGSDSYIYLPFKRTPVFAGTSTSALTAGSPNVITLSGNPSITAGQTYYLFLVDGTRAGMSYTVTASDSSSVTINLAGDNLVAAGAVTNGTKVQVVPYDTLGTIFASGAGVVPSVDFSFPGRRSEVYLANQASHGINLPLTDIYFYYAGGTIAGTVYPAGWRSTADPETVVDSTAILYPDSFFFVRNKAGYAATTLTLTGTVAMSTLTAPINTLDANKSQDNAIALPVATALTLTQTNLHESNAFVSSTSRGLPDRGDELYVWDRSITGTNRAAARIYYYLNVAANNGNGPGWRLSGDEDNDTVRDTMVGDSVLGPNTVIMIRKKATLNPSTAFWTVKPPYVP